MLAKQRTSVSLSLCSVPPPLRDVVPARPTHDVGLILLAQHCTWAYTVSRFSGVSFAFTRARAQNLVAVSLVYAESSMRHNYTAAGTWLGVLLEGTYICQGTYVGTLVALR